MRSKKIEEKVSEKIIQKGDFSSVLNHLDYSKVESTPFNENKKYTLLGICASLAAIGIIVGSAFVMNAVINKRHSSKDTSTETSNDPSSTDISKEVPSLTYNTKVYYVNTQNQIIEPSRLGSKLDEFDIVTSLSHQNVHVSIYSVNDQSVDKEIAAYFSIRNAYYSYLTK